MFSPLYLSVINDNTYYIFDWISEGLELFVMTQPWRSPDIFLLTHFRHFLLVKLNAIWTDCHTSSRYSNQRELQGNFYIHLEIRQH